MPGQEGTLFIIQTLKLQAQTVFLTFQQYRMKAADRPGLTLQGFIWPQSLCLPFKMRLSVSLISFNCMLSDRISALKIQVSQTRLRISGLWTQTGWVPDISCEDDTNHAPEPNLCGHRGFKHRSWHDCQEVRYLCLKDSQSPQYKYLLLEEILLAMKKVE